jgi:tRNA nucleotidyltransferase/poly(A) polymerase
LPAEVKRAFHALDDAGYVVYLVGGCVRDFILGRVPKDFDLVTDATPDEILELFPEGLDVGKKFGVIKLPPFLEIATFRSDGEYVDGRHPNEVTFGDPFSDVLRRDFTVNGLLLDFKQKRILDAVGGLEDLKLGVIRAIGDPKERLNEDALRLLRAVRFSVRFQFPLEKSLREAILSSVKKLKRISNERIRDELQLIFLGANAGSGFSQLKELGILSEVLPEAEKLTEKIWKGYEREPAARNEVILWSILFSGIGRDDRDRKLQSLTDRFKLSRAIAQKIHFCLSELPKFKEVFEMRDARLLRWVREEGYVDLLELHRVFSRARDGNLMAYEFCKRLQKRTETEAQFQIKLLSGADLIDLGLEPGKRFSKILAEVEDLQFEGKLKSKREAIEFVLEHYVK